MWLARVFVIFVSLTAIKGAEKESKKKSQLNQKRATDPYSYPLPTVRFNEDSKAGGSKTKVIVETIKSISPPEYLPPDGYVNSPIDSNTANLQAPAQGGSVSYNAYEPDAAEKKSTILTSPTTVTSPPIKKKSGGLQSYKYYGGASAATSISTSQPSSTISPAPVRTTSVEPATTLPPGYQYTSRVSSASQSTSTPEKSVKIGGVKPNKGYSYSPAKIVKKPTRLEPKLADSKPEETGFNGYHYDVGGGLSYEAPTKHTGPQPGMMGLSYMRSSSPYYNYHVMLD